MKYLFCTDFHLGVKSASHTTIRSQNSLQKHIYEKGLEIVTSARESGARVYNLGDMFHRHSNKEPIVLQGLNIARQCHRILAGNHDVLNIAGTVGSLRLVGEALRDEDPENPRVVIAPDQSEPYCYTEVNLDETTSITFVPHCLTQELFEASVQLAMDDQLDNEECFSILCLHCNVNDNFGHLEEEGATLCLTEAMQKKVLERFNLVLVGHEHKPQVLHKGRLQVLGNLFPVSFGEIEDRYVYWFDTKTKKLTKERIFDTENESMQITHAELLDCKGEMEVTHSLVEITGNVTPHEYPELARAIKKFWDTNEETLFAVRNMVEIDKPSAAKKKTKDGYVPRTLQDVVKEEADTAGFGAEYEELIRE